MNQRTAFADPVAVKFVESTMFASGRVTALALREDCVFLGQAPRRLDSDRMRCALPDGKVFCQGWNNRHRLPVD